MSTPIDQLRAQYAAEHSDFSGKDGLEFALDLAHHYALSGPDCQNRCVVHRLLEEIERLTAQRDELLAVLQEVRPNIGIQSSVYSRKLFAKIDEAIAKAEGDAAHRQNPDEPAQTPA